jgi:hypothetical protein
MHVVGITPVNEKFALDLTDQTCIKLTRIDKGGSNKGDGGTPVPELDSMLLER